MSADTLRRAAARMRELAEAATPGPWKLWGMEVRASTDGTSNLDTSLPVAATRHESGLYTHNADHIAAWDPTVALAVAAWLDLVARLLDDGFDANAETQAAFVVARRFLRIEEGETRG